MYKKHIIGNIYEKLISGTPKIVISLTPLPPISIINACNLGIKAPPTIDIIKPAEPTLDCYSVKSPNAIP